MTPENSVKSAIIEWLLYNHWLVIRVNQGAATAENKDGEKRYIRFAFWQFLGSDQESRGIADILAVKEHFPALAVEVKAPGKLANLTPVQDAFLTAWRNHGGIAVVAERVEDVVLVLEGGR